MINPVVMTQGTEVWFTLPGNATRHGYIRTFLKPTVPHGSKRYVIADDYGVLFVADERNIERPTSRAILSAESDIVMVIAAMAKHAQAPRSETAWVKGCIRDLEHALYELAKPEATDRSV